VVARSLLSLLNLVTVMMKWRPVVGGCAGDVNSFAIATTTRR